MKQTHVHVVSAGETLQSLAERYGLDSWRAIYDAPGNAALRRNCPDPGTVREGLSVIVPQPIEKLLRQRLQMLYRIKPVLTGLFDEQDRLLERLSARGLTDTDFTDTTSLAPLLHQLDSALAAAIDDAAHAAAAIAETNQALLQTHWHCKGDLAAVAGSADLAGTGLPWLVSGELIAVWRQLWSSERLLARHRELEDEPASRWLTRELTTVRSRVLQRVDLRIRQSLAAIAMLDGERARRSGD
jgi:hypothetical protein